MVLQEWLKNENWLNYHCHSMLSNLTIFDSPTTPEDYINRIKELNHTAYVSTEHGISYNWVSKYLLCKEHNIKFIYGVEAYIEVENSRYHILFTAKNYNGLLEINRCINQAVMENFKYLRPCITIEMIKQHINPQNVFCTTACIAGILKDNTLTLFKELHKIFGNNLFLEVQPHQAQEQIELNKLAKTLGKEYGLKLIGANDSHYIYPQESKLRDNLLEVKRIVYSEDADESQFYMDYPDKKTMFNRFMEQNIWTENEVMSLIDNTNILSDVEDIILDTNWKIPSAFPNMTEKEKLQQYINIINKHIDDNFSNLSEEEKKIKVDGIKEEILEVVKAHIIDYQPIISKIVQRAKEKGGAITTSGRGCFVPDTQVLTMNGYKNIQDVLQGDCVINKQGSLDTVINVLKYNISEDLYTISSYGNKDITLTNNHQVYCYNTANNNFEFIEARNIDENIHYLTTPIIDFQKNNNMTYDLLNYTKDYVDDEHIYEKVKGSHYLVDYKLSPKELYDNKICHPSTNIKYRKNKLKKDSVVYNKIYNYTNMSPLEYDTYVQKFANTRTLKRYISLDYDLMFLIGVILSDGNISSNKNYISIYLETKGKKSEVVKPKILEFVNKYNINYSISQVKQNMEIIYIKSNTFKNFILTEFKIYNNKEKYFNISNIFNFTFIQAKGLYDGLLYSDGSFDCSKDCINTRLTFDNKSKYLNVLFNLLSFSVNKTPTSRTVDKRYDAIKTRTLRKGFFIHNNYLCTKIKKIDILPNYKGDVYDLTIKNDPSFMVENIIVHNSASSYYTNKIFGFTSVDRFTSKVPLLMERFMTADKVLKNHEMMDIDNNIYGIEKFVEAQKEILGKNNSAPIVAYGTLKTKSAFKLLCNTRDDISPTLQNEMSAKIDEYQKDYDYADEDEKDDIRIEDYLDNDDLVKLYQESKKYLGIVTDLKKHASAYCIADHDIVSKFGILKTRKNDIVLNLEGTQLDILGYVKIDWLQVDVVGIIEAVYKEIGIPVPSTDELYEMVKGDKATWDIYENGLTMCVNQVEKPKTRKKVMRYKPKTVEELASFISAVRPSFMTYYKRFENREHFEFGLEALDKLLQGEFLDSSWILYQESIMLLVMWLGFEKRESAKLMKFISKKKKDKIAMISQRFHEKCEAEFIKSGFTPEEAKKKTESIWEVIENAGAYGFNASHALNMAFDSLYVAWAKAHYPKQTYYAMIKFYIDKQDKKIDKISKIKSEAQKYGIQILNYKFRQDNRTINMDENGNIVQCLFTIKKTNIHTAEILYELRDWKGNFVDLYNEMKNRGIKQDVIKALIYIEYFSEFGTIGELLWVINNYKEVSQLRYENFKKTYYSLLRELAVSYDDLVSEFESVAKKHTDKTITFNNKQDYFNILYNNKRIEDISMLEKIFRQIEILEYTFIVPTNKVGKVKVYKPEKNSLLLEYVGESKEQWFKLNNSGQSMKKNDIVYLSNVVTKKYQFKKNGEIIERESYIINQCYNLTSLFKK